MYVSGVKQLISTNVVRYCTCSSYHLLARSQWPIILPSETCFLAFYKLLLIMAHLLSPTVHQSHVDTSSERELCNAFPLFPNSCLVCHHQVYSLATPSVAMMILIHRRQLCSWIVWTALVFSTVAFLLPWQFSQFTLLTQVSSSCCTLFAGQVTLTLWNNCWSR